MRVIKFLISLVITILLIYLLDNRWVINGNPIPPLAKFLDPFNGFWRSMEPSHQKTLDPVSFPAVQHNISVSFDSLAIPHIFADNDLDLYFAQGYITARHRLWQMEFLTHAAAGRVSEITGPGKDNSILDYDRGQRRLGMVFAARNGLEALAAHPEAMIMVEKYTEGVNAYIQSLGYRNLPFEYKLLDYRPESWTPLKCMLLLKSMAQSLSMGEKDMEMTNALKLFGRDLLAVLYPDREDLRDPVVNNPGGWKFHSTLPDTLPLALPDELIHISKLPKPDPTIGSNNWAVSGSKTATGAPILAGDPHLDLSLPSLWYAIQLNAPGINTMGASLPGLPGVIIGCTDSIAWSETNAQRDAVDWYRITFKDKSRSTYLLDGQWMNSKKLVEKFAVRDGEVVQDTVVYTQWGPIPYDEHYRAKDNRKEYAFRWLAHDPSADITSIYKLNRATNYATFTSALEGYSSPAQNFVFASVTGDIGMRVQGKFPLRREMEGKFVLDGSKSSSGWLAFIPSSHNIVSKNPLRGFESSANQYPADSTYPYYVTANHYETYRNRRINKVLSALPKISVRDIMDLQTDNYSTKAEESLPTMLKYVNKKRLSQSQLAAYEILAGWKYADDPDSEAACYYQAWFSNLMTLTWDEMSSRDTLLEVPTSFTTIRLLKEDPEFPFFDIRNTRGKETARDIVQKSFLLAVDDIEAWKASHGSNITWGDYKNTFIRHLLRIEPLGVHVRGGGNHDTVNALSRSHGPSWRMIVSLETEGVKVWASYPGGQSGNPGSRFYKNMLEAWVKGEYFPIHLYKTPSDPQGNTFYTVQLIHQE